MSDHFFSFFSCGDNTMDEENTHEQLLLTSPGQINDGTINQEIPVTDHLPEEEQEKKLVLPENFEWTTSIISEVSI